MNRSSRLATAYAITAGIVLVMALADLLCGPVDIGLKDIAKSILGRCEDDFISRIINVIRGPRVLSAALVGACLAIAGAQMQSVFRNPLADPHIFGLSAGAGTGVAIFTAAAGAGAGSMLSGIGITAAASAGALVSAILIALMSTRIHRSSGLLVAGVMLGFVLGAITSIIEYQADEAGLKMYWNWAAGSFSGNTPFQTGILAIALAVGTAMALANHKGLTLMLFGEEFTVASGGNVKRIRIWAVASCCILAGASTAFCGPVGFAGIIAPHIARWTSGRSSMICILPLSALTGAAICLAGDFLAQCTGTPLPAGSTTALVGIPVIFYLMSRYRD